MAESAIALIGLAASVAGTVYSAYSQERAADKAEKAEERQAAMIAEQAAERERQERERAKRFLATQRGRIGASGITTEGSPLLNLMETQEQFERDLLNIRRGYQWELSERLSRAEAFGETGRGRAGATLLTGLGDIGTTWYSQYRQSLQPKSTYEYKGELAGWDYW